MSLSIGSIALQLLLLLGLEGELFIDDLLDKGPLRLFFALSLDLLGTGLLCLVGPCRVLRELGGTAC